MPAAPSVSGRSSARRIGVLSVQGDFAAHAEALRSLGALPVPLREPADLDDLAGLVMPGGESTTMSLVMRSNGVWEALARVIADGVPVLATCAGVILLARQILDGRSGQHGFGAADICVRRNGFGRQVFSFEARVALPDEAAPFPAVFIRAPVIEQVGAAVEVLARLDDPYGSTPVLCRQGPLLLCTFHPELTGDLRVHRLAFDRVLAPATALIDAAATS